MNSISIKYYTSPVGELILGSFDGRLCLADWRYRKMRKSIDQRIQKDLNANYIEKTTSVLEQTSTQFDQFFAGKVQSFNIPVLMVGTNFQKSVWNKLLQIPFGETETYMGLSKKLGNKKAIRAVASANGANAISIIVPCHRVIGSNGALTGYAGGLTAKKKILELEGSYKPHSQLDLFR